ncbi:MAG: hypothetical protein IPG91_13355 [Ideonella sp.]|nr:hypothetical protein [Ideonella sp.]
MSPEFESAPAQQDLAAPGLPGEERVAAEDAEPAYGRAFSLAAFTMNRFIVDQVIRAARHFDNDTEAMILFGTIAHLNVAHLMPPGSSPTSVLGADGRIPGSQARLRPVRLRDLSQIMDRPRETIRRKLERLEAQGRLLRGIEGYVINVASVDPQMHALSVDAVRRFMQASGVIGSVLQDAQEALARERAGPAPRDS